jgi:hypothetical protein
MSKRDAETRPETHRRAPAGGRQAPAVRGGMSPATDDNQTMTSLSARRPRASEHSFAAKGDAAARRHPRVVAVVHPRR